MPQLRTRFRKRVLFRSTMRHPAPVRQSARQFENDEWMLLHALGVFKLAQLSRISDREWSVSEFHRAGHEFMSDRYFTPPGCVHREDPSPDPIPADEPWQPDVYKLAGLVAQAVGAALIVDVGCGDAKKLWRLTDDHRVLGLDVLEIEAPPGVRFQRYDVLGPEPIPEAQRSLLIAADAIEHLTRPEILLDKIRCSGCLGAVVSTPDRLQEYGHDHGGPPLNPRHVREWTATEFERLLSHHGLDPLVLLTKTHVDGRRWATIVAICT